MKKQFLLSILLVSSVFCGQADAYKKSSGRLPNILFILVDDLGYGQLGFNGQDKIATPNIDKLAKQGIEFTQAYSGSTVCSPSRISLMTGRDGRHLHSNNNAIKLRSGTLTFPQVLQAAGYETTLIGKWGIGTTINVNDPLKMGFDSWYGFLDNISAHRQYPTSILRNNRSISIKENTNGSNERYAQELFTDEARAFISKVHENPFFLYLSYTSPHGELAVPKQYYDQYRDSFSEKPYMGMSDGKADTVFEPAYPKPVEQPNATMAAMITALDAYIGEVLVSLKEAGIEDNTLVVFTSDNGPHAEGGADPAFFGASKPFRGIKRDLLDGGIHVPMLVRWPNIIAANQMNDTPVAFSDMLPTISELVGVTINAEAASLIDGFSILPILMGAEVDMPERVMYWEFVELMNGTKTITQAARRGNWKAIRSGGSMPLELYNIMDDTGESINLAEKKVEVADAFLTLFNRQLKLAE